MYICNFNLSILKKAQSTESKAQYKYISIRRTLINYIMPGLQIFKHIYIYIYIYDWYFNVFVSLHISLINLRFPETNTLKYQSYHAR